MERPTAEAVSAVNQDKYSGFFQKDSERVDSAIISLFQGLGRGQSHSLPGVPSTVCKESHQYLSREGLITFSVVSFFPHGVLLALLD